MAPAAQDIPVGGPPKKDGNVKDWLVYAGNSPQKMDDLGVPPFQETSILLFVCDSAAL